MKIQFLLRREHNVLTLERPVFNPVREATAVYCENRTGHIITLCGQSVECGLEQVERILTLCFKQEQSEHAAPFM